MTLSDYPGSQVPATCLVKLIIDDPGYNTVVPIARVDGVPVPLPWRGVVPYTFGRFEEGTLIELEASGTEPGVTAGIEARPFYVVNGCEGEGCVARAEYRVTGYCSF